MLTGAFDLGQSSLSTLCEKNETTLPEVVSEALKYFQSCRLLNGSIVDNSSFLVFQQWDSVNALKTIAQWRDLVSYDDAGTIDGLLGFLRTCEKPSGMLSWGVADTGPAEYCTETSSEYISALALLGHERDASVRANFLRSQQLSHGPWEEVHSHIPAAFQTESSVTGFALMAFVEADVEPLYLDKALDFLAKAQRSEGHFGINWYYYNTYYYLMRPAIAALATYEHHSALAKARKFVLSQQQSDGSWYTQVEGFGEFSSPEQHTALALATLVHAGMTVDDPPIRRAVNWLLERRRPDGSWNGGSYPYPGTDSYQGFQATQHIFTTAQVLLAFYQLVMQEADYDPLA